jgi:hypothetical protein
LKFNRALKSDRRELAECATLTGTIRPVVVTDAFVRDDG